MNEQTRAEFEQDFPVPADAFYSAKQNQYMCRMYPSAQHPFNDRWETWQLAHSRYARCSGQILGLKVRSSGGSKRYAKELEILEMFKCATCSGAGCADCSETGYIYPRTERYAGSGAEAGLLEYILQDDIQNRLTPRIIDIAYTAFMLGKQPNHEDGGVSDWFNDTKPAVMKAISKLRSELLPAQENTSPSPAVPEGYALMPIEPTEAMVMAAKDFCHQLYNKLLQDSAAIGYYKAMLNQAIKESDK